MHNIRINHTTRRVFYFVQLLWGSSTSGGHSFWLFLVLAITFLIANKSTCQWVGLGCCFVFTFGKLDRWWRWFLIRFHSGQEVTEAAKLGFRVALSLAELLVAHRDKGFSFCSCSYVSSRLSKLLALFRLCCFCYPISRYCRLTS